MDNTEFYVNLANLIITFIAGIFFFLLAYQIMKKDHKKVYYEVSFLFGLLFAGLANVLTALFRIPYALNIEPLMEHAWYFGSFLFFAILGLSLSCVLATGLGILTGKRAYYFGRTV